MKACIPDVFGRTFLNPSIALLIKFTRRLSRSLARNLRAFVCSKRQSLLGEAEMEIEEVGDMEEELGDMEVVEEGEEESPIDGVKSVEGRRTRISKRKIMKCENMSA